MPRRRALPVFALIAVVILGGCSASYRLVDLDPQAPLADLHEGRKVQVATRANEHIDGTFVACDHGAVRLRVEGGVATTERVITLADIAEVAVLDSPSFGERSLGLVVAAAGALLIWVSYDPLMGE